MEWIADPGAWLGLLTLIVLEIVLGIDNLIFIAILANKLPPHQRDKARVIGLSLALLMRLLLLMGISWLVTLTEPLFSIFDKSLSGRDLILLLGGLFLLFKATVEVHERLEGKVHLPRNTQVHAAFWAVVAQIIVLDAVFSLDAVITAVGMVEHVEVMMIAVVIAMIIMIVASKALTDFVNRHPTVVMLCLGFLLMIGFSLVAEGAGFEIPKGYLYGAIAFSVLIEVFNQLARSNRTRNLIGERPLRDRTAEAVLKLLGGRSNADEVGHDIAGMTSSDSEELAFEHSERTMIRSVLQLSDRPVQSLMTPRPDIVWVDASATPAELLEILKTTPQTRLLVARDELDNLLGVVQSRDLLTAALDNQPLDLAKLALSPLAVPEGTSALKVLEMLRQETLPLAIVIDEYGSIRGVVTTGDLLAAIAGELADTNDEPLAIQADDGWMLDGSISLEQLEELLHIKLDRGDGDYFTLGGLMLEQLQHVPVVDEEITLAGHIFRIKNMEGRRILHVHATPVADDPGITQIGY
ncbi:MAG: TerC family protein [Cellvibrio sp.]|uniref:TerC family protein n=1 Tax=Cellvibrio sp. TaxID=1965322 RepID=UPI0031ADDAD4